MKTINLKELIEKVLDADVSDLVKIRAIEKVLYLKQRELNDEAQQLLIDNFPNLV